MCLRDVLVGGDVWTSLTLTFCVWVSQSAFFCASFTHTTSSAAAEMDYCDSGTDEQDTWSEGRNWTLDGFVSI